IVRVKSTTKLVGEVSEKMRINRKALLALALIIISSAPAAVRPVQAQPRPATSATPVVIPFELVTRHIVLNVKIDNSRPLSFVFDTGDKVAIVDLGVAKELALKLHGQIKVGGAGSNQLAGALVDGSSWTLPGLEKFSQPVVLALPFGDLATRFGHDFDGIVGS